MESAASENVDASSRFKSWSILRWASILPACALVVPSAEKKRRGEGEMEESSEDHVDVSVEVRG